MNGKCVEVGKKSGEVWVCMDELSIAIEELKNAVDAISTYTERVCSPEPPEDPLGKIEKDTSCDLSRMINSNISFIRRLANKLQSINKRIEI